MNTNIHAIVMPNKICNLACSYCYVLDKPSDRMPVSLAKKIVNELLDYNDKTQPTRFIWHGGEPMLAGIDFYEQICCHIAQKYPDHVVEHYIQTNGLLLKNKWVDFFLAHDFKVGVSMDGSQEFHDACRKDHQGRGSFDRIYQNILKARQKGLVVGLLSVITRNSLGHEEEIFKFFYNNQFSFGFHPITSLSEEMDRDLAISAQDFADVTNRMFDLSFQQPDKKVINVTPVMHYAMAVMLGCPSGFCVLSKNCGEEYISIEPDGQVQVCDRFAGNEEFAFGNIATESLMEILQSPVRQRMLDRWQHTKEQCLGCEWEKICYGGCMHESYVHTGSIYTKDTNCPGYKQIFSHISSVISNEFGTVNNQKQNH